MQQNIVPVEGASISQLKLLLQPRGTAFEGSFENPKV